MFGDILILLSVFYGGGRISASFIMPGFARQNIPKAQFRRRASAVSNLIAKDSTVVQHKHDSDSDVVPKSCQIQDLLKSRNN